MTRANPARAATRIGTADAVTQRRSGRHEASLSRDFDHRGRRIVGAVRAATNFNVTNNAASSYVIGGNNNPTLTLTRGQTYTFTLDVLGHPFWSVTARGAAEVNTNAFNTGFVVPSNAASTLFYQCGFHDVMGGQLGLVRFAGPRGDAMLDRVPMIQLFGSANPKSFNTLKLRFALAEIGVAYQFVPVDLAKGESRTAQFLRINPHGKVPVLLDDDFALPESDAILWYLGEKYPDAKLLPRLEGGDSLQARAQILRFLDIASTAVYPAYSDWWNATNSDDDPAKRNAAAADAALAKVTRALGVLEKALAAGDHLVGAFSLADIAAASIIFSLKRRLQNDPLAGLERTRAWYERVTARPAWRAVSAD